MTDRKFEHQPLNIPEIFSEDTDNGRFYTTPEGNRYPSVTTFLSKFSDNSWLEEWKNRVGEDQVQRVSTQAKRRGTSVHTILEQYLLNNKQYARGHMPNNLMMFGEMRKVLDSRLGIIRGLELGLWSDALKVAGRSDMVAVFDDVLSIVDFKTSKNLKNEQDIQSYFLQCTLYSMMVEELTRLSVPQIVVLIGVDHERAQVFIKDKDEFVDTILSMF